MHTPQLRWHCKMFLEPFFFLGVAVCLSWLIWWVVWEVCEVLGVVCAVVRPCVVVW